MLREAPKSPIARAARHALHLLLLLLALLLHAGSASAAAGAQNPNAPLTYRVRMTKMTPAQPTMIHWTYGGAGLGGNVVSGIVTQELPEPPGVLADNALEELNAFLDGPPADRVIVNDGTWDLHYLNPGVWSRPHPLADLPANMMTMGATGYETGRQMTNCEMEFEVSYQGEVIKTFTIVAEDLPNFGVIIPFRDLGENGRPTPEFLHGLGSLLNHARNKQALLRQAPWFNRPLPRLAAVLSDCGGRHRTGDFNTILAEIEVMRMMGMNGFRGVDLEVQDLVRRREGIGREFTVARIAGAGVGFPIPGIDAGDNRAPIRKPGDGCPYLPANRAAIPAKVDQGVSHFLEAAKHAGVEHYWGLTGDEIGNVYGSSNEGAAHPGACPHCSDAFRAMVRDDGRTLEDFGATTWDQIRPVHGYWALDYWQSHRILSERLAAAEKAMADSTRKPLGLNTAAAEFRLDEKEEVDYTALMVQARERLKQLEWSSKVLYVPEEQRKTTIHEKGWRLLDYYSREFLDRTSAGMFTLQKKAVQKLNDDKRKAIARGERDTSDVTRPWLYTYGLRQPRFTWGGGSIGWFDYYRRADTAMVYETSNRDARVWQWDSYMNDLGRSLQRFCGVDFGVYVKPHRGAPVQRALSAAMRGSKLLYWYTYGPEWSKGDSFGGSPQIRASVALASRLIAAGEDVFIGGDWVMPAEVAIVRPRTATYFSGPLSWENGKWNYMALAHAHIPMDPVDEVILETADLSPYKVIVVSGTHIRRASARRLRQWVAEGGTLYTNGFGMAMDEQGKPLKLLHEVFGVTDRAAGIPLWGTTRKYGATRLSGITPTAETPADARVTSTTLLQGDFLPAVGCEILSPTTDATVLATNARGKPVAVSHRFGKGKAYLIGTYAGLEYATDVMPDVATERKPYDGAKRTWVSGPILAAGVQPVVKVSHPLVESGLIGNPQSTRQVLPLIYWRWNRFTPPELENVTVTFRGFGDRRTVRSTLLQRALPVTVEGPWMTVTLPSLGDADVLIIE